MRQQTLTQIGYVDQKPPAELELGEDEDEDETLVQEVESTAPKSEPKPRSKARGKAKGKKEPTNKRRKTMGDAPNSSFHTQTLTQLLPATGKSGENSDNELLIRDSEDEDGEDWEEPTLPTGNTPRKIQQGPETPATKRIKVNLDEVPSSQPTPFTPMIARYSPARSPLKGKSTNVNAPPPTIEITSKLPRTLVIQDSYSEGPGLPSSSLGAPEEEAPKKERSSQKRKREPLSEIPVSSLDLKDDIAIGETPTRRRRGEIPDSDDELSVRSTPFKTPRGKAGKIWSEPPGSGSQAQEARESGNLLECEDLGATPIASENARGESVAPSTGASNKENRTPEARKFVRKEEPGTPTPTLKSKRIRTTSSKKASTQRRVSARLSAQKVSAKEASSQKSPLQKLVSKPSESEEAEELTASEDEAPTPTLPKARLQKPSTATKGRSKAIVISSSASEASISVLSETPSIPSSSFNMAKAKQGSSPILSINKRRHATPQVPTSETSTNQGLSTPTPVTRKVQIKLPQPTVPDVDEAEAEDGEEEIYHETPQKPRLHPGFPPPQSHKKSSPVYRHTQQRQTQPRSQFYSQGLESQRLPLEIIQSLGPQTDRSDALISLPAETAKAITDGWQNHLFRTAQPLPGTVSRVWIYTCFGPEKGEVKYMATVGPCLEPGDVKDVSSGLGNAEFNTGRSGYGYAHELVQVYRLNDTIQRDEMVRNGLRGQGGPEGEMWRWVGPAVAGGLLGNLRCELFLDGYEGGGQDDLLRDEEGGVGEKEREGEGGVTISQELEEQLRSEVGRIEEDEEEEEEMVPDSPIAMPPPAAKKGKGRGSGSQRSQTRSQTRTQAQTRTQTQTQSQTQTRTRTQPTRSRSTRSQSKGASSNIIRPSQATTASDVSSVPSSREATPSPAIARPRTTTTSRDEEPSLPDLLLPRGEEENDSLLRGMTATAAAAARSSGGRRGGVTIGSSSQPAFMMDSLLVDDGEVRRPPEVIWDSDDDK